MKKRTLVNNRNELLKQQKRYTINIVSHVQNAMTVTQRAVKM